MGRLEIYYSNGTKRITNLHSSFFDVIRIGKSVTTPQSKARDIQQDEGAKYFKLFRGEQEL